MFYISNTFKTFLIGVVTGIVIATVGITGIGKIIDKGVNKIKYHSVQLAD